MFNLISNAYAQSGAPASGGGIEMFLPMIIIFAIFYFLIIRPQQKQQKQKKLMIQSLNRGDEVVTLGGIYGKITELHEEYVMLQIAKDVTIKFERAQINNIQNQSIKP